MELNFADVKPSFYTWVAVGLMAMSFSLLAKYLVTRYPIPGVTESVLAS